MTDDLVAFLAARLDEDEEAARQVEGTWRQIDQTGVIVASDGRHAEECASAHWAGVAEHIARHDPARVLRDVAARRAIVTSWRASNAEMQTPLPDDRNIGVADGLDEAVCYLAAVYADHPDYQEEWAPSS